MARRTRRKSRKSKSRRTRRRRRQSGGSTGVAAHASAFGGGDELHKVDIEEGMDHTDKSQKGGRRKRNTKGRKEKKKRGKKRKLNSYFKLMLAAKKKGATSFKYNGSTYKRVKRGHLHVYKKA